MINKKCISPVVATSLLLVVAILAVIGFQNWFGTYSTGIFSGVETKSSIDGGIPKIDGMVNKVLYIRNPNNNLTIKAVRIDGIDCYLNGTYTSGLINLTLPDSCYNNVTTSAPSISVITNDQILDIKVFLKDTIPVTPIPSLSSSLSCPTDSDGDGFISYFCAIYPMTNPNFEGHLDANDNNNTIVPDMSCVLADNKSGCEPNFIVNGCGTGTVLDIGTDLCWQRNLSSYKDYDGTTLTWAQGKTYCGNLVLGGHSDWRLPTRQELFSITDLSRSSPAIVGGNNNKFQDVVNDYYWTYSTYGPSTALAWIVGFNGGDGDSSYKTNSYYVVCVR